MEEQNIFLDNPRLEHAMSKFAAKKGECNFFRLNKKGLFIIGLNSEDHLHGSLINP